MDSSDDPNLDIDENGLCRHCRYYDKLYADQVLTGAEGQLALKKKINEIKNSKKGKYDCILGLSGGVDSSYVAYLAGKNGLNPLCVHFDNGWNSELAIKNIEKIVNKFDFDLYTYVIDWEEFKDLQLAYLKASVVDIEVLTDHAIYGTLFKIAKANQIEYVLGGLNVVTEGILPYHWTYNKLDFINIKSIHKRYGKKKLTNYPFLDRKIKSQIKRSKLKFINYLNYVEYNYMDVKETLVKFFGWQDYGGKHYESIWTRFYQGYILPKKFGIDKRKAHLSTLICSGQITKEEAIKQLSKPIYPEEQFRRDFDFVLKKLELSEKEFEDIMNLPVRDHREFDVEGSFFNYYPMFKFLRPLWRSFKSKYTH